VAHAALLLADELAERSRDAEGRTAVPRGDLLALVGELLGAHAWAKTYRESASGGERLLDDALEFLEALRLVRRRPEGVEPLPAVARYRVERRDDA
jgi:hypothetical protein